MAKSTEEAIVEVICAEAKKAPLCGRYFDIEALSIPRRGAFSVVLRAKDARSGKYVVLKLLSPSADVYRADCFNREAAVAAALTGRENVIQLTGELESVTVELEHPPTGARIPFTVRFFALEIARETLTAFLFGTRKVRPVYRRLQVLRDVVKGVARLHRVGYCHRDLKPDNILLFSRGVAKVADLGTCRLHSGVDPIRADYHMPVGDLMYAAPEMYFAGGVDPKNFIAADWFSVGAMIFEAVTGQLLYVAIGLRDPHEIMSRLGAVADIKEYEKRVANTAGRYPIPDITEFSEPWLAPLGSSTQFAISTLIRDLCNFNFKERLVDFSSILRRLDISILRAKRDQDTFNSRRRI